MNLWQLCITHVSAALIEVKSVNIYIDLNTQLCQILKPIVLKDKTSIVLVQNPHEQDL